MKTCRKCNTTKPVSDYNKSPNTRDGLQSTCRVCQKEANRQSYLRRQDEVKARNAAYKAEHPEVYVKARRKWKLANRDKERQAIKEWFANNPSMRKAYGANRRAALMQRTPLWADLTAVAKIYETCPEGHQVDHIVPLQGELVSGLHVEYNLQHLPAAENAAKCNKFDPDTFNNDAWLTEFMRGQSNQEIK